MYYEEKIINDVLCTRGTPDGEWIPLSPVALTSRYVEVESARILAEGKAERLMTALSYFVISNDAIPENWHKEFAHAKDVYISLKETD